MFLCSMCATGWTIFSVDITGFLLNFIVILKFLLSFVFFRREMISRETHLYHTRNTKSKAARILSLERKKKWSLSNNIIIIIIDSYYIFYCIIFPSIIQHINIKNVSIFFFPDDNWPGIGEKRKKENKITGLHLIET